MAYRFKRQHRGEGGVDDWLMTYADMITLLLCFFVVFLSVSMPKKEIFDQARQKVIERFSDPYHREGKAPSLPNRRESHMPFDALPSIVGTFHGQGDDSPPSASVPLEPILTPAQLAAVENRVQRTVADDSYRLTTLEMPSAAFFASGSADLSDSGARILQDVIAKNLTAANLQDFQITVEGHTDDVPIRTVQFPSNWELSTARAAAVVRFFIDHGIAPQRLRAAGYADAKPKMPNRDAANNPLPENQAQNRRVVIKLEKVEKGA